MKLVPIVLACGLLTANLVAQAEEQQPSPAADKPAVAAQKLKPVTYQDWQVVCGKDQQGQEHCRMGQPLGQFTMSEEKSGKEVAFPVVLQIIQPPGTDKPFVTVEMPLNVPLPPGIALALDSGVNINLPYQTCNYGGTCVAALQAKASLISAFKKGNGGRLGVYLPGQGKPAEIPFSLLGFTKAYNHFTNKK